MWMLFHMFQNRIVFTISHCFLVELVRCLVSLQHLMVCKLDCNCLHRCNGLGHTKGHRGIGCKPRWSTAAAVSMRGVVVSVDRC